MRLWIGVIGVVLLVGLGVSALSHGTDQAESTSAFGEDAAAEATRDYLDAPEADVECEPANAEGRPYENGWSCTLSLGFDETVTCGVVGPDTHPELACIR